MVTDDTLFCLELPANHLWENTLTRLQSRLWRQSATCCPNYGRGVLKVCRDRNVKVVTQDSQMPRHLISDAHEWINEIPTVPIYYLAKPQPRERTWEDQRGKKTLLSLTLV